MATEQQRLEQLRARYNALRDQALILGVGDTTSGGLELSTGQRLSKQNMLERVLGINAPEPFTVGDYEQGIAQLIPVVEQASVAKEDAAFDRDLTRRMQALQAYGQGDAFDPDAMRQAGQIALELQEQAEPLYQQRRERESARSLRQMQQQLQTALPYIDEAQSRSVQRNLAASERFKAFKEQLPTTIQAIMSAKQQQLNTASDAFLKEAQAAATQQQAASGFASLGTGRRFG
jgi:hypothetical protein